MEFIEFLSTDKGIRLLQLIGGGLAALGVAIWIVIKFFASKQGVSAHGKSVASGRDTTISFGASSNDKPD